MSQAMENPKEPLCTIKDILRVVNDFESNFYELYGIGLNEGILLCCICRHESCCSGHVAELLGLTNSNASKVIASVERKGLIERRLGKEDKRQMYFSLTPEGKECLQRFKSKPEQILHTINLIKNI